MLCFCVGAFTFWLGFPGFIIDTDTFRVLGFVLEDFGPPMNTPFIWLITLIFGKHTFYLFLLNNITLYLGIWFLIAGFYLRFRSVFALALILIAFIGNIYLGNFIAMNYILMANFIFDFGKAVRGGEDSHNALDFGVCAIIFRAFVAT